MGRHGARIYPTQPPIVLFFFPRAEKGWESALMAPCGAAGDNGKTCRQWAALSMRLLGTRGVWARRRAADLLVH